MSRVTRRSDQESLKAFLTERVDVLRRPYARAEVAMPRRFVFWGTANSPPLRDLTGSTRFVCIPLPDQMLPLDWAAEHCDAIWARAVEQFRLIPEGQEPWDRATEAEQLAVAERNANHQELDPWADTIESYLRGRARTNALPVKVPELLTHLEVPTERHSTAAGARARAIAESLGWVLQQRWIDRKTGLKARGLWPPVAHTVAHTGPHQAHTRPTPADPSAEQGSLPVAHMAHTNSLKLEKRGREREGGTHSSPTTAERVGAFGVGQAGHPSDPSAGAGSGPAGGVGHGVGHGVGQAPPAPAEPSWLPLLRQLMAERPDAAPSTLAIALDPIGAHRLQGRDLRPWMEQIRAA